MSYDSKNIGAKAEKPGKTHKSKKIPNIIMQKEK